MKTAEIRQTEVNSAQLYAAIEKAIIYLQAHSHAQPDLQEVADFSGISPYHFQRTFTRLVGISPKRFLQYTTLEAAKTRLNTTPNLLDVAYDVGLSGGGRLHDLFVNGEAASPGIYKNAGESLQIVYGVHPSPFGYAVIAQTPHGICELSFASDLAEASSVIATIGRKWSQASLREDAAATRAVAQRLYERSDRSALPKLHLRGTNFQLKVWQALLQIPCGALTKNTQIPQATGSAKAVRAVGTAVGDNPIAYLIPCHRVLRKDGGIGGYATGLPRKQTMLAFEALSTKII
ncbi:MAG: bifunctional helix-turn-helix domain-containing protein/methylated-DNA--[protein]-cysteine S-methyltransferase [Alphaproteobacteria bacterium]|nr:bifunctional helix-turn-helix domain-containing protein/methylated-DNA--[protein]-cysteine S-methyltransferase [Alphaproteobacteria bacterium]